MLKNECIKNAYGTSRWMDSSWVIENLCNEESRMGTQMTTVQKHHISGSFSYTSLCRPLGCCFFALNFVKRKMIKCFSMKLNKYWKSFCCYVLVFSTTLKKVFSRWNFSDNSAQALSSMHSSVQLLYLLLFFSVVVGVAVFVALVITVLNKF